MVFFFECYGDHRDLHVLTHSFPTRRSSDLAAGRRACPRSVRSRSLATQSFDHGEGHVRVGALDEGLLGRNHRSEEHTSELQSLMRISYAVFCLKKQNTTNTNDNTTLSR